jgi:hypothetical protein
MATREDAEKALASGRAALEQARNIGADVRKAAETFKEAEHELRLKYFDCSTELSEKGAKEVISARAIHKQLVDAIFTAETAISKARQDDIDIESAETLLESAVRVRMDDPDKALALARQAVLELQELRKRKSNSS